MANSGVDPAYPIEIESSCTEQLQRLSQETDPKYPTFAADSEDSLLDQVEYFEDSKEERKQELSLVDTLDIWSRPFPWDQQVTKLNERLFRNDSFKPLQREIINATKSNKDVIGLLPTGGGKSLTFQLTAHTEEGVTVIIYPLISLIANQKQILRRKGLLVIDAKDFQQTHLQAVLNYEVDDRVRLIVTTPQYLSKCHVFLNHLDRLHGAGLLARFVIDQAHCLVQWGNSFREDYLWMGRLKQQYPEVPILALSATLSPTLEKQLIQVLQLKDPILFRSDLNRANIEIKVVEKPKNFLKSISLTIQEKYKGQSGIIYCSSRNNTEKTAQDLRITHHLNCEPYHAGMSDVERKKVQDRWMRGTTQVVVATIAFGLGIDKPNVRFVMHICFPKSLENYIQEIGRCGRDGKPAIAILYYRYSDRSFHNFHIESSVNRRLEANLLYNMLQVLEEPYDCLRKRLLKEMGQQFFIQDCKKSCSNCKRRNKPGPPAYKDFSNYAIILGRYFRIQRKHLTVLKLIEAVKSRKKENIPNLSDFSEKEIKQFKQFASCEQNLRRLCIQMLKEGIFTEEFKEVFQNVVVNLRLAYDKERELNSGNIKIQLSTSEVEPSKMPNFYQEDPRVQVNKSAPVAKMPKKPATFNINDEPSQDSHLSSLKQRDLLALLSNSMDKELQDEKSNPFQSQEQLPPPYHMITKSPQSNHRNDVNQKSPQFLNFPAHEYKEQSEPPRSFLKRKVGTPNSNLSSFLPTELIEPNETKTQEVVIEIDRAPEAIIEETKPGDQQQEDENYFSMTSQPLGLSQIQSQSRNTHIQANSSQRKRTNNMLREQAKQARVPFSLERARLELLERLIETKRQIKERAEKEQFAYFDEIDITLSHQFLRIIANISLTSEDRIQHIPLGIGALKRSLRRKSRADLDVIDCYGMNLIDTIKQFVAQRVKEKLVHSQKQNVQELLELKEFVDELKSEIDEAIQDLIDI